MEDRTASPAPSASPADLKGPSVRRIPDGDDRERLTCPDCGYIAYENPKIVAGAVVLDAHGRVVLCRRAIDPRRGFWTIPAGYMENGETAEQAAIRETFEEARASIALDGLMAVYSIPRISQVQLIFRARLTAPHIAAGPESLEVDLFEWDALPPVDQLAFPTVEWALTRARLLGEGPIGAVTFNPPDDTPDRLPT